MGIKLYPLLLIISISLRQYPDERFIFRIFVKNNSKRLLSANR
jgi:hypothetical protein